MLRKLWEKAIFMNRTSIFNSPRGCLARVENLDDLRVFRRHLDLACLDEVRASLLGMPEDAVSFLPEDLDLEVCRLDLADRSKAFGKSRRLSKEDIASGRKVDEVWQERFSALAEFSRHITLLDRYSMHNHKLCLKKRQPSGLRKLVTQLGRAGRKRSLTVCCSDKNGSETEAKDLLMDVVMSMNQGGLASANLFVASEDFFSAHVHFRYLRFDRTICSLDTGIEVLAGTSVRRLCEFKMSHWNKDLRKLEDELKRSSSFYKIL
jgi:hypothetical protein